MKATCGIEAPEKLTTEVTEGSEKRGKQAFSPRSHRSARGRSELAIGRLLLAVLAAGAALAPAQAARADEESPALARYRQDVDAAVDRALAYLAREQLKDGSFPAGMRNNTGIASLCVMALLSKGHTPGNGPYGEAINRGLDYVLSQQKSNGMLVGDAQAHGPMYSHTIAMLMLAEVSGMVDPQRQARLDNALSKALEVVLAAQKAPKDKSHQGGWRYQHTSRDSDISLTGWAVMSLRSARGNGASVPREAIDQAIQFVLNCRTGDGGFAYQPGGSPGLARTGTALLCLALCGRNEDPAAVGAGEWILRNLPRRFGDSQGFFYYAMYYCSQGMFQLGGRYWEAWAAAMYEMMLRHQQKDGSWPRGTGQEGEAGPCYSTAMSVLAMGVTYRQLPIYQR